METTRAAGNGKTTAVLGLATTAVNLGEKAVRAKLAVDHAVDDGVRAVREAVRRGRYAAEDFVGEATLYVRRNPLASIGWAFASGAVFAGTLLCAIRLLNRKR
jgi:ElaB/YqjD/DUF883 family membrane-anchored ribosome-binding protein